MRPFVGVGLVGVVALVGVMACTRQYQAASAGPLGCLPDEVVVTDVTNLPYTPTTWTAECHGRRFSCTGMGTNVTCSPMQEPAVGGGAPPPPAAAFSRYRDTDGALVLAALLYEPPFQIQIQYSPERAIDDVFMVVRALGAPGQRSPCALALMVDAQVQAVGPSRYDYVENAYDRLGALLALGTVELLVAPHRVAGRICDEEWRLSADSQAVIAEFLQRVHEERVFRGIETAPPPPGPDGTYPGTVGGFPEQLPP